MENLEVSPPHQGGQGQDGVPQVPLLGHGSEIETPNWACREFRPRKENCKVSKPRQGGQVPPATAACCHYLLPLRAWVLSRSRHIYLIVSHYFCVYSLFTYSQLPSTRPSTSSATTATSAAEQAAQITEVKSSFVVAATESELPNVELAPHGMKQA